jgi:hypothetical protein
MSLITRLLVVFLLSVTLFAQHGHRDPTPEDRDANPDRAVAVLKTDTAQAARDSEELLALSQSVYTEVRKSSEGTISKDTRERLKKIERLSKKLRAELMLN